MKKLEPHEILDFRGQRVRVGDLVAYAGRSMKDKQHYGPYWRGRSHMVLCRVRKIDPEVKRTDNKGNGPNIVLATDHGTTITTRDLGKIAVLWSGP